MTITTRPRWSLGHGKPLVPSGWQATADYPGGQSRTAVNTSSGAFVTSLATTAAFTPYGANLTLIGDLDPGAGYQMQNVECSQTGGHTFHCVARGNA